MLKEQKGVFIKFPFRTGTRGSGSFLTGTKRLFLEVNQTQAHVCVCRPHLTEVKAAGSNPDKGVCMCVK